MRLAELELMGFKSFPTRTVLNFNSGITSIVGPNGCGKSNLVDSIRWVLGEQSAKSLRGERMESVIFTGSNSRNSGSMAEVSLVIESNGDLTLNGSEKTRVTRRLYRSGESEYLLNGMPCLLRDILELFADTGVGASAYTVMEQGMVESLISDRDDSRREVFDEAAGITKYKLKRRLAARKLESTEADLLRLTDLVAEVEKQVNSLKRQMRKAEGYKKIKDELKVLEVKTHKKRQQEATQKLSQIEEALQGLQSGRQSGGAELATRELELEQLKLELLEIEKTLQIQRADLDEISSAIFRKREAISVARQKAESQKENYNRLTEEIAQLSQQKVDLEQAISNKKVEAVAVLDRLEKVKTEQTVFQGDVEQLQRETNSIRRTSEELSQTCSEKLLAVKDRETRMESLRVRLQETQTEQEEKEKNLKKTSEAKSQLELDLSQKEFEAARLQSQIIELTGKKDELHTTVLREERQIEGLQKKLKQIEEKLASETAKKEVLTQILKSYEGYQEGVRKLIEQRERFGLADTVANLLQTEEAYALAVEAALGEKAGYLVASNSEQIMEAIDTLKEQEWGEAGFVIADLKARSSNENSGSVNIPAGLVPILNIVRPVNERWEEFYGMLLKNVYLVPDSVSAQRLLTEIAPEVTLVTPSGELFSGLGVIKGGKKKSPTLVGRQEQIQQAEVRIEKLSKEAARLKESIDNLSASVQSWQNELEIMETEIERVKTAFQNTQIDLTEFKSRQAFTLENLHNYQQEIERLQALVQEYSGEIDSLQAEFGQLQTESVSSEKALQDAKQKLQLKEKDLAETSQKLNDKMIELITLQGQKERLENDSLRLVEAVSQAQISAQAKAEQKEKTQYDLKSLEEQTIKDQEELKLLDSRKQEQFVSLNEQAQKEHRLLERINLKEQELKGIRKAHSEGQEEIHRLDLDKHELVTRLQQLQSRIWEEYEIDLNSIPDLTPEEEEKIPAYQEEIFQLRNRLKSYGAVNLLALEDYQREKERLDFLQKQVQDLISAKETLQSTITKINDTARSLFMETFQQVKANFQKVLANLFDGGEADLILEEGIDPLEAKIEIMAKPRGKKLVTLAQLSGGEKALVAISLLFSLYLVKPSPFCILDEVDAPLDDSNIGRFIKLVRQFTDRTQFIIITHNKLTMEEADTLYGVTMIEPGVSQLVSVRLNKEPAVQ